LIEIKYTLKNRPRKSSITKGFKSDMECFVEYVEEWFEGFEKELRERLTQLEQGKRKTDNSVVIASRLSLTYLIKEILGES